MIVLTQKSRMFLLAAKVSTLKSLLCLLSVIQRIGTPKIAVSSFIILDHYLCNFTHDQGAVNIITSLRTALPAKRGNISIHFVLDNNCYMYTMYNSELCGFGAVTHRNVQGLRPDLPPVSIIYSNA